MQTHSNGDSQHQVVDPLAVERAAQRGVQEALWRHKMLGETIVYGEDGTIVRLTGDEIPASKPES